MQYLKMWALCLSLALAPLTPMNVLPCANRNKDLFSTCCLVIETPLPQFVVANRANVGDVA